MQRIEDGTTFQRMLIAQRAVLVLHAIWSMPSVIARLVVTDWEQQWQWDAFRPTVELFVAETMPDSYHPVVVAWLEAHGHGDLAFRGSGEVLWLERGRIVLQEYTITPSVIANRTQELWKQ